MDDNVVLAGAFEGAGLKLSSNGKCAYVLDKSATKYINKINVDKISEVNRSSGGVNIGDAMVGEAVFGRAGTLMGINPGSVLLEINWKDGTKSLVSVDNTVHKAIIVGMYSDVSGYEQTRLEKADTTSRNINNGLSLFLFLGCTLFYFIAWLMTMFD